MLYAAPAASDSSAAAFIHSPHTYTTQFLYTRSNPMKKFTVVVIAIAAVFAYTNLRAGDAKKEGKEIFTANKCTTCHSIDAAGVKGGKKKDLSVATMKEDALEKYVMQETKLNDKKHPFPFKGSKEDLTVMAKWLASMKAPK
jgi:mono/diheme cytochrome c family protein